MTSYQGSMEKAAVARGVNLPISTKVSYEISNAIRGMSVAKAITYLEEAQAMDRAVPYKRFGRAMGHKSGMASGRYPIKTAEIFIRVIKGAISNAKDKGLQESSLVLAHICPNQGAAQWHHGRQSRRKYKATHLEVVVKET